VTGAALLVDTLVAAGVRHLFTLSGNQILGVYDATIGRDLALIHTRHEAAAVHMADGWARLADTPGVALVTAGPGHLNALGALYTALMAESPVVLLSGHAPRSQLGRGAFQEVDQVGAARPVAKAAWMVEDPAHIGEALGRALELAAHGRPGPVHLSLPADVLEAPVSAPSPSTGRAPVVAGAPIPETAVEMVHELLAAAARPLIVVGPALGRGWRAAAVAALVEATEVPALVMESPRGTSDPALRAAVGALAGADLLVLLGKRLDFSLRFGQSPPLAAGCRVIRIDSEPAPPDPPPVALDVVADPAVAARRLAATAGPRPTARAGWARAVDAARRARPAGWAETLSAGRTLLHPLQVCAALQPHLDAGGVLVSDGGEFGQWAQAALDAPERLINGPSGSIGSALPLALGARLARPDRPIFVTLGDGTFGFHALELDTAVRYGLPVVAVVGNDGRWNAEHQIQLRQYGADRTVACDLLPSRYDRLAEALGGHGEHVTHPDELGPALARALASGRPACVNVRIDGAPAPSFAPMTMPH
jgi:acetolactate synthase-1/2/3 large subunit